MIGLIDGDLLATTTDKHLGIPNVEIMKLSSYFQIEERQYCRLLLGEENDLSGYEKVFFFSETSNKIPECYRGKSNIIFGGSAFTGGVYKPFDNPIIDYTIPKTSIYKSYLKEQREKDIPINEFNSFLDGCYYRMYIGKEALPIPSVRKNKKMVIYDKNFFINDWEKMIVEIGKKNPRTIYFIHPIECNSISQFFALRNYEKISKQNEIILNLPISLDEVPLMLKKYANKFLATIVKASNIYLPIGRASGTKDQYLNDVIYTLNLLYSFWNYNIPIKLKMVYPKFGKINPILNFTEQIANWSVRSIIIDGYTKSIKDFINADKKSKKRLPHQEQYEEFIKYLPNLDNIFDVNYSEITSGRRWII